MLSVRFEPPAAKYIKKLKDNKCHIHKIHSDRRFSPLLLYSHCRFYQLLPDTAFLIFYPSAF